MQPDANRVSVPSATKWSSDEFLDRLRSCSDELADNTVAALQARTWKEGHPGADFRNLFETLQTNDEAKLRRGPPELGQFFSTTWKLPEWVDRDRLDHGQSVFTEHAVPAALVLLAKSLPAGYAAPNLAIVLNMSGDLRIHPYTRLLGVLQAVVAIGSEHGFEMSSEEGHSGGAIVIAQKLRLLHSAIRIVANHTLGPEYEKRYGIPINLEDMLATIMGFSLLVVEGMDKLGVELTDDDREDYYLVWRVFAVMCGIHPTDDPSSSEYVPQNLTEAAEFYESYKRRWFETDSHKNPNGVSLAKANLRMMKHMMPWWSRALGLGIVPRLYMQELLGRAECRWIGIHPVPGFRFLRWLLLVLPDKVMGAVGLLHGSDGRWAMRFLQKLIVDAYGKKVTFLLPQKLDDLRLLAPPSALDDVAVREAPSASASTGT